MWGFKINFIETIIIGSEALILLATLLFMYYQHRKTMEVMGKELSEIRKENRLIMHEDLYDKLLSLYYKYIENTDDLKDVFEGFQDISNSEVKKKYVVFAVLDILFLMYMQQETLDESLRRTWKVWSKKVFEEEEMHKVYENCKNEYPQDFRQQMEKVSQGESLDWGS